MKRSYIVVGPESSGTRMITNLLINAGVSGTDNFSQDLDYGITHDADSVVWRKSIPHVGEFPDIFKMAQTLKEKGYTSQIVVTNREWYPMMRSQIKNNHVNTVEEAYENIRYSHYHVFNMIQECIAEELLDEKHPFVMVYYESITNDSIEACSELFKMLYLSLDKIQEEDLYNGNEKWYNDKDFVLKQKNKFKGAAVVKPSFGVVLEGSN